MGLFFICMAISSGDRRRRFHRRCGAAIIAAAAAFTVATAAAWLFRATAFLRWLARLCFWLAATASNQFHFFESQNTHGYLLLKTKEGSRWAESLSCVCFKIWCLSDQTTGVIVSLNVKMMQLVTSRLIHKKDLFKGNCWHRSLPRGPV